jgi:hypothetical protein
MSLRLGASWGILTPLRNGNVGSGGATLGSVEVKYGKQ